jgi:hypothetical protein
LVRLETAEFFKNNEHVLPILLLFVRLLFIRVYFIYWFVYLQLIHWQNVVLFFFPGNNVVNCFRGFFYCFANLGVYFKQIFKNSLRIRLPKSHGLFAQRILNMQLMINFVNWLQTTTVITQTNFTKRLSVQLEKEILKQVKQYFLVLKIFLIRVIFTWVPAAFASNFH